MKKPGNFLKTVQLKTATSAIGPSSLRGQGKGVIGTTRRYLARISLARIPRSNPKSFRKWLDRHTEALLDEYDLPHRPWGAARKALNLFLRDALYNKYLSSKYKLSALERWLEIPLDSVVAVGLKKSDTRGTLPSWPGLKYLTAEVSDLFQSQASELARQKGISMVHLDMYLWLENR